MLNKKPKGGKRIAAEKRIIEEIAGNATSRMFMSRVELISGSLG